MKIVLSLFPFFLTFSLGQDTLDETFTKTPICFVDDWIQNGCQLEAAPARSLLDCLSLCQQNDVCTGASLKDDGVALTCLQFKDCSSYPAKKCTLENVSPGHVFYSKNFCQNKGEWHPVSKRCVCQEGWIGERCLDLVSSCDQLVANGYHDRRWHRVTLDLSAKNIPNVVVKCYVSTEDKPSYWIKTMKNNGLSGQLRSWTEYKTGFQDSTSRYWLGLNQWRILSLAGENLLWLKIDFGTSSDIEWRYSNFVLAQELDRFAFTFDFAENMTAVTRVNDDKVLAGNCLNGLINVPFSTFDNGVNSDSDNNCAQISRGGWWFKSCPGPCNLMGRKWDATFTGPDTELLAIDGVDMATKWSSTISVNMYVTSP